MALSNPILKAARSRQYRPAPEEKPEDGLLKSVGRKALSGLGMAGNVLDLPGSMVRDVLAGSNPLDQLLSPTTADNRTTGRDLLRKAGLAGKRDTWGNWGAGLAVEIATDPLTLATLGAGALAPSGLATARAGLGASDDLIRLASKAAGRPLGKEVGLRTALRTVTPRMAIEAAPDAAKAATAFETAASGIGKKAADLLDEPLGSGVLGYKVPFTSIQGTIPLEKIPGLGKYEPQLAAGLDALSHVVRKGKYSPIRFVAPLFHQALKGATSAIGQDFAKRVSRAEETAVELARRRFAPHVEAFERSGVLDETRVMAQHGLDKMAARRKILDTGKVLRNYVEQVGKWQDLPPDLEPLRPHLDDMKQAMEEAREVLKAEGLSPSILQDPFVEYFPRVRQDLDLGTHGAKTLESQVASTSSPFDLARQEELRGLPGGTSELLEMSVDPKLVGIAHALPGKRLTKEIEDAAVEYVKQKYPYAIQPLPMSVEQSLKTEVPWQAKLNRFIKPAIDAAELEEVTKWLEDADPMDPQYDAMIVREQVLKRQIANPSAWETPVTGQGLPAQGLDQIASAFEEAEEIGDDQIRQLVRNLAYQDPQRASQLVPMYSLDLVSSGLARVEHAYRAAATARAMREFLVGIADLRSNLPPDAVALSKLMGELGFTGENAQELFGQALRQDKRFTDILGPQRQMPVTATVTTSAEVAHLPKGLQRRVLSTFGKPGYQLAGAFEPKKMEIFGKPTTQARDLVGQEFERMASQIAVPAEIAADMTRVMKAFQAPEEIGMLTQALDWFTRVWKAGVTTAPAFHSRNFFSAAATNIALGAGDAFHSGPLKYAKPLENMDRLLQGEAVEDLLRLPLVQQAGIKDAAAASDFIRREMFAHGVTGYGGFFTDTAADIMEPLATQMPGLRPSGLSVRRPLKSTGNLLREAIPRSLPEANPLNIAGVAANRDVFAPVKASRRAGNYTEDLMRGAGWLGLVSQGIDPAEAARRVKFAHVDYRNLSEFERRVLRRVAPFYSFTKGALANLIYTLSTRPGGRVGQGIRAINSLRDPDELTPDYVAETAAIPLPGGEAGGKRFLTGLGLQQEDPLSFLGGGLRGALLEAGSRLNPAVKMPLEWMTGQTFFQKGPLGGRPLDDLDPTLGRLAANLTGREKAYRLPQSLEFVAANSPISRLLTSARQVTDARKGAVARGANALTGFKVTDVSPAAQDAILRERVQELLKAEGARPFVKVSVPKDELATMPPEQQQRVRELQDVLNLLARRTKQRRQAKEKAAK